MRYVEYYEANDGTRFQNEAECMDYETSLVFNDIDKYLKVYDADFNSIKIGSVYDTRWQIEAYYYIIYDPQAFAFLAKCENTVGISHPNEEIIDIYPDYPVILEFESIDNFNDVKVEYEHYSNVYNTLIEEV